MVKKYFKCEYYQVTETKPMGREPLFDLRKWINEIDIKNYEKNIRAYKQDRVRIENIQFDETYKMWFLRFFRIRSTDNPSLCKDDEPSEYMNLGDRYVSEDVTCLYDPENSVIMIQKNSHSVSPLGIELYLNETWHGNELINLRKVVDKEAFAKVRRAEKYRRIQIRVADVPNVKKEGLLDELKSTLGDAIRSMSDYYFPYCELTFSVGKTRNDTLEDNMIKAILKDIEDVPEIFDKASVQILEENETKSEFIDLFTDSAKDIVSFNVEKNKPLTFETMNELLANKYCHGAERGNRKTYINFCLSS